MNKRILYILIVVVVLALVVVLLGPKIFGTATPRPPTSKRSSASDSGATAKGAKARGKSRAARRAAAETEAAKPVEKVEAAAAKKDTTPLTWAGDPFVRDWLMAGELRDMRLRAVTIGEKSLALINDRVVARGDTINGKRVAEITRDSVVFEFGGQRRGLKIGE